jgi:CBS domain-containing protein
MTEKLARRGVRASADYAADFLDAVPVSLHASKSVVTLSAERTLADVRAWLAAGEEGTEHQGFPITGGEGALVGVLTRRDLLDESHDAALTLAALVRRDPVVVHPDHSLREAADHMVRAGVGRVVVVSREGPRRVCGILTRSDLLRAHEKRLDAEGRTDILRRVRMPYPRAST